jgi:hypothetical protein
LHFEDEEEGAAMLQVAFPMLTWPVAGVGALVRIIDQLMRVDSPFLSVELLRGYAVPVLLAVPGTIVVVCFLGARWIKGSRPSHERPLETPFDPAIPWETPGRYGLPPEEPLPSQPRLGETAS